MGWNTQFEQVGGRVFMQASVRPDYETKIRQTVKRLRAYGREVSTLYHFTQKPVPKIDFAEDRLSDELQCTVKIRDFHYIVTHANDNTATMAGYYEHLSKYTAFLQQVGASRIVGPSKDVEDPTAYVFLEQEVANRHGNTPLIQTITDSLIMWALNGTDPDTDQFMSRKSILEKITVTLPWAKQFIRNHLDQRLEIMASKANTSGREVRWHKKRDMYCLPFETRQIVAKENAEDEALRIDVRNELIESVGEEHDLTVADIVAGIALRAIELFFEHEGLLMSYFVNGKDKNAPAPNTVVDRIEAAFSEANYVAENRTIVHELVQAALRHMFYSSTEKQRQLLSSLSRTYLLLFTLKAEPRVVEYFQRMTQKFCLYVGTDVLLIALTERYVPEVDRRARTMLQLASRTGAKLYLSEPILDELISHIRATDFEFRNHYSEIEPYMNQALARHSDRILIRTYFYAKFGGSIKGWKAFIGQFCTWDNLHNQSGKDDLRSYLISEFGLEYVSRDDLLQVCDVSKVKLLAEQLLTNEAKKNDELAFNDALMVHSVYGLRNKNKEARHGSLEFGYTTWWLTHEVRIQKHTFDIVRANGARYIMRPEFLLNYFSLCPSREEILTTYRNVFPSTLGLQMGHRLKEDALHKILGVVREWSTLEPGRRTAKMKELSDRLKTDHIRQSDATLEYYEKVRD
jgi:hypothetical protein